MTTEKHRAQMRDRYRRLRVNGLCSRCGVAMASASRCDRCAEAHNADRLVSVSYVSIPERAE